MDTNVVIIGHVDHGKSTLIGRLLYDSESVTDGRVQEIQKLAEEYKKRFEFAYFLDSFDDELMEERTIDTTSLMFKGKNLCTVTDVPGHKEFIKNMLTGASHADVTVLVVAAQEGIKEQTGRHAFLIRMLGIKQVIVVVNKMDMVDYSEQVFLHVKSEVTHLLDSLGYKDIPFIPGSAMEGDNIYKKSTHMPWYTGLTLIETLDTVEVTRERKALRFVVQDIYTVDGKEVVIGRVESGTVNKGDEVIFQPSNIKGTIEKMLFYPEEIDRAEEGDSIGIIINCTPRRGDVCGLPDTAPVTTKKFLGEAVLLEDTLRKGDILELRCGTKRVQCTIEKIHEKLNSETGEVMGENPSEISQNEAATIVFSTEPLVVERFSDIPELGRFVLARNRNIAAGIVLETTA
jgi:small GTP-binding protein